MSGCDWWYEQLYNAYIFSFMGVLKVILFGRPKNLDSLVESLSFKIMTFVALIKNNNYVNLKLYVIEWRELGMVNGSLMLRGIDFLPLLEKKKRKKFKARIL